jgi:hypothetical protein
MAAGMVAAIVIAGAHWRYHPTISVRHSPVASPDPHRILAIVPLIADQRYYGEDPGRFRGAYGAVGANGPPKPRMRIAKIRCPKDIPNVKPTMT